MNLLVLGGTSFLGRLTVLAALRRGYAVTTFNRGRSALDVPGVEAIRGNRESGTDLDQLAGRRWDVVVDTSGYVPRMVGRSARLLSNSGSYIFVSSISACRDWPRSPVDHMSPTHDCSPEATIDDGDYGTLKAGCERAATTIFGERALIVRAGLLLGPYENIGRLPWWLRRVAHGGQVLAPGDPERPMTVIDARDLATWMLDAGEQGLGGAYLATGPFGNTTMGRWLGDCVRVTQSDAELVWVDDGFLLARKVQPWDELPLWVPAGKLDIAAAWDTDASTAHATGLQSRPVAETVADTWAWVQYGDFNPGRASANPLRGDVGLGLDPVKERRILADWRAAQ